MYKDLKKIYDGTRMDIFVMAVGHLLDLGFRTAKEITDEQIAKLPGNGLMTEDFVQNLVRTTREIAQACDSNVELIQFCMVENIFDTEFFAPEKRHIPYDRLSEIATQALWALNPNGEPWNEVLEDTDIELEDSEREFFEIPANGGDEDDDDDCWY